MVDLCPVIKRSGIQMVVWKPDHGLFMVQNKGLHPVFVWSTKSCDFTIWIPDNHTVQCSDESGLQVWYSDVYCRRNILVAVENQMGYLAG